MQDTRRSNLRRGRKVHARGVRIDDSPTHVIPKCKVDKTSGFWMTQTAPSNSWVAINCPNANRNADFTPTTDPVNCTGCLR